MIILFYNKRENIKIKYHNNIISSKKSEKKLKKNSGGDGCSRLRWYRGGRGYLQRL